jgi:hypothetical protein
MMISIDTVEAERYTYIIKYTHDSELPLALTVASDLGVFSEDRTLKIIKVVGGYRDWLRTSGDVLDSLETAPMEDPPMDGERY